MLRATGKVQYDPAHGVVRFVARQSFAGLTDETVDVPAQLLEVAYLTMRQLSLAQQGVTVQIDRNNGALPAPNGNAASVPQLGSPPKGME